MSQLQWPIEHDNLLEKLCLTELSYTKIATEINRVFGTNYSRNAVIGVAHRRGFTKKFRVKTPSAEPKRRVRTWQPRPKQPVEFEDDQPTVARPDFLNLTFDQLDDGRKLCRFPIGGEDGGPMLFCGLPVKEDSSYCPACHSVCLMPPPPPKKILVPYVQFRKKFA